MPSRRSKRRKLTLRPKEFGKRNGRVDKSPATSVSTVAPGSAATDQTRAYWLASTLVTGALFVWLFGPTVLRLIKSWNTEQDYSHGFLVAPVAAFLLWIRRDSLPTDSAVPGWGGLGLLALSFGIRFVGERLFLTPLAGWALVVWLAGACWLVAGRRVMVWALPGLLFLPFMIPLPFRVEQVMSWHLQTVATKISSVILQCLGQPAITEGHTIYLGEHVLEIEQACSGLRMFMGIAAVAYVFFVLNRRSWWEKAILVVAVGPVAILSNAIRVVVTGLLMQMVSGEAAARFSHDAAGWGMIIVAAGLFGLTVVYLSKLFVPVEIATGLELFRRSPVA